MTREERKAYCKNYYKNNKEKCINQKKNYYKTHDKKIDKSKIHEWYLKNKEKCYEYKNNEINKFGNTLNYIRQKSRLYLKSNHSILKDYEIHHCFGYEDYRKFIYIPKELHYKIHSLLKENNINPKENHWKYIVNLINSFEKYIYISV